MKRPLLMPMYYGASSKLLDYAKAMRRAPTVTEKILWDELNKEPFSHYKFRRQHPIATFIADFYSHPLRLVIEADGKYHLQNEQKQYDLFRDEDMNALGIQVIRFTNYQISQDIELVLQQLIEVIQLKEK